VLTAAPPSQPGSRRGDQKINLKKYLNRDWSRHHSLLRKTMEKPKIIK